MDVESYEKNMNKRKEKEQSAQNLSYQLCIREIGLRAWIL